MIPMHSSIRSTRCADHVDFTVNAILLCTLIINNFGTYFCVSYTIFKQF